MCNDELAQIRIIGKSDLVQGRMREDHDAIRWKRRRVSVCIVHVVGDHEIDFPMRWNELARKQSKRTLGVGCSSSRQLLERRREMNSEVTRLDRSPAKIGNDLS